MALGSLAGVPHVGEGGGAQQVRDQVQLLDGGRGLQQDIVKLGGKDQNWDDCGGCLEVYWQQASMRGRGSWCCVVFIDPSVDVGDASHAARGVPGQGGALTRVSHFFMLANVTQYMLIKLHCASREAIWRRVKILLIEGWPEFYYS